MPGKGTAPGAALYPECGSKTGVYLHRKHRTTTCAGCRALLAAQGAQYRKDTYLHGSRRVPAVGSQRRIRALAVMGWSQAQVGATCGMSIGGVNKIHQQQMVSVEVAQRIGRAFDLLAWQLAPGTNGHLTRVRARGRGWAGPLDWDEASIEDPLAVPWSEVQAAHSEALAVDREYRRMLAKRNRRRARQDGRREGVAA